MAVSKSDRFNSAEVLLADVAKALSHPARIRILQVLTRMDACMCGDIVSQLPLSQATVSQHLKELKRVGLIQGNIDGPKTCYCIDKSVISKVSDQFSEMFSEICCGNSC